MSIGHFPQSYKIYKNKTSKDVSLITYFIFFIGSFIWLAYGIILNETPIIISFIIGVVGSFSVLFMALKYK
jgi:MtN3 and saliva related transmembrane protein